MSTASTRLVGFQTEESAHFRSFHIKILQNLKQSVFDNDTFFEIVGSKSYEHFRNFQCSPWTQNRETGLFEREMRWVDEWTSPIKSNMRQKRKFEELAVIGILRGTYRGHR